MPGVDAERFDGNAAAEVRAVAGMQTGLVSDQAERMCGAYGAVAGNAAGIGIKSAGDVDGQHRTVQRVDMLDAGAQPAGERARPPYAQQAVDHQRPALRRQMTGIGDVEEFHHACARPLQRPARVFGLRRCIGMQGDGHAQTGLRQTVRGFQRIAAIVTGAGQNQDVCLCCPGGQGRSMPGAGFAGALHQRTGGEFRLSGALDPANFSDRIKCIHIKRT